MERDVRVGVAAAPRARHALTLRGGPDGLKGGGTGRALRRRMILRLWWGRVRDSLWALPGAMTLACVALAIVLVRLEAGGYVPWVSEVAWLYRGGSSAARGVLGTIAGSLITVTGVVFSVTIVALQLASSQFSPRVLHGFIRDRPNQIVLGVLIGTFTYALLVMRSILSAADDREVFVPALAVTTGIALLLASVAALIYFIDHSARSIRVEVILQRQTEHARHQIERVFPETGTPHGDGTASVVPAGPATPVAANGGGYVQALAVDAVLEAAAKHDLVVVLAHGVGAFVLPGETVARVWPRDRATAAAEAAVRDAFVLGHERTPHQDVEFGFVGIADIAMRALSPGIHDPTTAILCVDRLAELLVLLARRARPERVVRDDAGVRRVVVPYPTFDVAVAAAFDAPARAGAGELPFVVHLLGTIGRIATLVPPACRIPLRRTAEVAAAAATQALAVPEDRTRVLALLAEVRTRVGGIPADAVAADAVAASA